MGISRWSRDLTVRRGNGVVWVEVTNFALNNSTYFTGKTPVTTGATGLLLILKLR